MLSHHSLRSLQIDSPIPFVIPYDVWVALFAWLDFTTLQSFSLVCRDFKHDADKYIWRACTLHAPWRRHGDEYWTRKHIEEGCRVLLRDSRASRLRELTIDIAGSLGVEGGPEVTRILALIMEVLQSARKLRSLRIKSILHREHIASALSNPQHLATPSGRKGYPFRLERFATDLLCDHNLYGFWSSQAASLKHIEVLTLADNARRPPSLPYPLPCLTTAHITVARQTAILRLCPLRTVDLAIWEGDCTIVKENICAVAPATIDLLLSDTSVALPRSTLDASASCSCSTMRGRDESSSKLSSSFPAGAGGNTFWRGNHFGGRSASSSPSGSRTRRRHALLHTPDGEQNLGPGILDLRLTLFDILITSHAYTNLIAHLPHLRSLRLTHGDMASLEHRREALEVLAGLQDLEVFEWAGGSPAAQADVFAVASKRCKSLREIVFRWGNGNHFERRFEREGEDAGWGIVQS